MISLCYVRAAERMVYLFNIVHRLRAALPEHGYKLVHHARNDHCVVACAVVVELRQSQMIGNDVKLEAL